MGLIDEINAALPRDDIPFFRLGGTLKVHVRVVGGSRTRIQISQGVIVARQDDGVSETFIIREVSFGVSVECTFPVHTPSIEGTEVVTRGQIRHVRLHYLCNPRDKAVKVREHRED